MFSETTLTNGLAPLRVPTAAVRSPRDDAPPQTTMRVAKRNGTSEAVDVNKIVRAVSRCCVGLAHVDALRVATKTISGLYDGATTRELDRLSIQTAAALIADEPQYAKLAARLLGTYVDKEVRNQGVYAFSQSIAVAQQAGLVGGRPLPFDPTRAVWNRSHRRRATCSARQRRPTARRRREPPSPPSLDRREGKPRRRRRCA